MSQPETMSGYDIKDEERTAFGLGWEHRRRGLPMSHNPFEPDHWKWADYRDGWREYRKPSIGKVNA